MAMQEVEYEFPDSSKEKNVVEVEVDSQEEDSTDIDIASAVGREIISKPGKKGELEVLKVGDVEIEVEDDTPPKDRGRKASAEPEEVTDGELENYSEKVKKRIQHFSKGYHDERRAKEQALREREALEEYTKTLVQENSTLRGNTDKNHNVLVEQAKKQAQVELDLARRDYKEAYEAGDTDKVVAAQEALTAAKIRTERAKSLQPRSEKALQPEQNHVQKQEALTKKEIQRDDKAEAWREGNAWFGADREMTSFALGVHAKLTEEEGLSPQSDTYYERINARMRQVFPDHFDDGIEDEAEETPKAKAKSSNVVAPATRSTSPKKVKLSQSQIAISKRLGVPLDIYAKQVAELMRKQNG